MPAARSRPLGYLVSRYPAVSHTFILQEVLRLRQARVEVHVASVNPPDRPLEAMTQDERQEARAAFVIKRRSPFAIVGDVLRTLVRDGVRFPATAALALRAAGFDLKRLLLALAYLGEAMVVAAWMRRRGIGRLHVHFATPAANVAMLAARLRGCPFTITVHGPDEFYDVSAYALREKFRRAARIVCISEYARSQVQRLLPVSEWDKCRVSHLGVDVARFDTPARIPTDRPLSLLCVGRLVAAKGQHVLLAALRRLHDRGHPATLTLIGDGPDRASLEREARRLALTRHVTFAGARNHDAVREAYRAADAFVLPSFAEGLPVVLMEAMASRLPCVTTWITGVPELITPERDGLLVAPGDVRALALALERLADDPALRRRLGEAARERVVAAFEAEASVVRFAHLVLDGTLDERVTARPAPTPALTQGVSA